MPARLLPELHCALRLLAVGRELPVVPRPGIERVRGGPARPGRRAAAGHGALPVGARGAASGGGQGGGRCGPCGPR